MGCSASAEAAPDLPPPPAGTNVGDGTKVLLACMTQHWRRRRDNWLGFDESNCMRAMKIRERAVAFTLHAVNARQQHTYTLESEGGWLGRARGDSMLPMMANQPRERAARVRVNLRRFRQTGRVTLLCVDNNRYVSHRNHGWMVADYGNAEIHGGRIDYYMAVVSGRGAARLVPPGHVSGAEAARMAARAPPAPAPPRPDARPPQPQPRRARAEDYDEFVAFTGVDRATAERFVDGALGRGLSLRDAIRAFFEGQGSPKPPPPPPLEVSFRTNGGQTFSAGDLGGAVTEASAVGELRALVAKHYDSEPKRIRLVSRGNILRDDAQTLGAAGVRPKDKLMVVVMKGATRFSKGRK